MDYYNNTCKGEKTYCSASWEDYHVVNTVWVAADRTHIKKIGARVWINLKLREEGQRQNQQFKVTGIFARKVKANTTQ